MVYKREREGKRRKEELPSVRGRSEGLCSVGGIRGCLGGHSLLRVNDGIGCRLALESKVAALRACNSGAGPVGKALGGGSGA